MSTPKACPPFLLRCPTSTWPPAATSAASKLRQTHQLLYREPHTVCPLSVLTVCVCSHTVCPLSVSRDMDVLSHALLLRGLKLQKPDLKQTDRLVHHLAGTPCAAFGVPHCHGRIASPAARRQWPPRGREVCPASWSTSGKEAARPTRGPLVDLSEASAARKSTQVRRRNFIRVPDTSTRMALMSCRLQYSRACHCCGSLIGWASSRLAAMRRPHSAVPAAWAHPPLSASHS